MKNSVISQSVVPLLLAGITAAAPGCSLLFDTSGDQCANSAECPPIDGTPLVCMNGLCVVEMTPGLDAGEPTLPFVIDSQYVPSGLMGDGENRSITVSTMCPRRAGEARGLCREFRYVAPASGSVGWGGVYWQFPANNWGTMPGYPMPAGAKSVSFWAWADRSLEATFQAGIAAADGFEVLNSYSLTTTPQRFILSLEDSAYGEVAGAFAWSTLTPEGSEHIVYIDDVVWTTETAPVDVAFSVDIDEPLGNGCFVGVFGSFNDWAINEYRMDGPDIDDVFTATIALPEGRSFEYLFYKKCGETETVEQMQAGSICTTTSGSFTNRHVAELIPAQRVLPTVCFESCDPCP